MKYTIPILLLILLVACPKPLVELDPAICDDGYHPCGPDSQECCLDTTGSEFTWVIDTIGVYISRLNDVEIVSDDNIWVVGLIAQQTTDPITGMVTQENYNVAHWDGTSWNLSFAYAGSVETHSITYFDEDDFWVTSSSFPLHWDGNEWTLYHLQNMGLNVSAGRSSWGTSSDNMWFVGNFGSIVHYDGTTFTKIESGTDINLYSVSGTPDGEYVFACGVDPHYNSIILQIHDSQVTSIYEGESAYTIPAGAPRTSYVYNDTVYFASGLSVWKYNYTTDSSSVVYESQSYEGISARSIIANTSNDIFMCGARSEFIHYNGARWTSDLSIWDYFGNAGVVSSGMDVDGDQVIIVGYAEGGNRGLIARGRRN